MKKVLSKIGNQLFILLIYCLPCLVAFNILLYFSYGRYLDAEMEIFCRDVEETKCRQDLEILKSKSLSQTAEELNLTIEELNQQKKELSQKNLEIQDIIFEPWSTNIVYVLTLALLPFLVLGFGLALSDEVRSRISDLGLNPKTEIRRLAAKNWGMKYLVAFIIVFGWVYVFFPIGQKATVVKSYDQEVNLSQEEDSLDGNTTLPILFQVTESPILNLVVAFLGWYLYLLSYFLHKLYKNDVVGSRVYALLFRKFLFVFGIALALSPTGNQSLLIIFIIGYLPLSTPSILKDLGINLLADGGVLDNNLKSLPSISRWDVHRLEEEGVSDIASLATVDSDELIETLPNDPKVINLWIDIATLMTVLGTEKYNETKEVCLTASHFVERINEDKNFVGELAEKFNINNASEIAKILTTTFSITSHS